jgi:hypothetical protein
MGIKELLNRWFGDGQAPWRPPDRPAGWDDWVTPPDTPVSPPSASSGGGDHLRGAGPVLPNPGLHPP